MDYQKILEEFNHYNSFGDFMGHQIEIIEAGHIKFSMEIKDHHLSSPNVAHGGAISSLMDAVLGVSVLSWAVTNKMICSTVEFKVNYLSPAHLGETLVGEGLIDFKGKSLAVSSGEIIEKKTGRRVAKGLGTFNLYPATKKDFLKEYFEKQS